MRCHGTVGFSLRLVVALGLLAPVASELKLSREGRNERRLMYENLTLAQCSNYNTIEKAYYEPPDITAPHTNMFGWTLQPKGFTAAQSGCWKFTYPMCGGRRQSPVHIKTQRRLSEDTRSLSSSSSGSGSSSGSAASGDHSASASGDHSASASGDHSASASGDHSASASGDHSASASGDHSASASGDHSAPASGDHSSGDHSPSPSEMAPGEGLMSYINYGKIPSQPAVGVDMWFKSVRADGDFGKITMHGRVYHAKHIQLVTSSLHKIDDENFDAEMLIFHELEKPVEDKPWAPFHDAMDTVVVSVLFKQSQNTNTFPEGSYSPLWEAFGFPRDRTVIRRNWKDFAKKEGMEGWDQTTLLDAIGATTLKGSFYGYHGSLPVPPCWENVIYFVLESALPVSINQVKGLMGVLEAEDLDFNQRPTQRDLGQEGKNNDQVHGSATVSCDFLEDPGRQATTACWQCAPGTMKSPVDVITSKAKSPPITPTPGFDAPNLKYTATTAYSERGLMNLMIRPADGHNFGMLEVGGRFYTADLITVHAVGIHAFDRVRYDGEIHIHHYLYGDWFEGHSVPHDGRRMDAFRGDTHTDESVVGGPGFQVIVAIPLQVTTNPGGDFMDSLQPHGVQSGEKAYASHDDLKSIFADNFYEYRGTLVYPACTEEVAHWIVYSKPLKVSENQLFTEFPTRSGYDTTPPLQDIPDLEINMNHVPMASLGSGTRLCSTFDKHSWTYADTHCWPVIRGYDSPNECALSANSPINIDTSNLVSEAAHHKDHFLSFAKYHPISDFRVKHNGHALQVTDKQNGVSHLGVGYLEALGSFYFLRQFHLHFPSEHVIDGHQHAAEMHLVHQKQNHWGAQAFNNSDLLVVGIFFDIGPEESPLLKQMFLPELLQDHDVKNGWMKTLKEPVDLLRALGPVLKGDYYRYKGGLTTPPCSEIVKWFVFKTSLSISHAQWEAFKSVFPNPANARPVQPMNGRKVALNSFEAPDETFTPEKWDFYIDRYFGRDREQPTPFVILGGVIGGILLAIFVMLFTFVRQNPLALSKSAGGLSVAAEMTPLGRSSSQYRQMPNQM